MESIKNIQTVWREYIGGVVVILLATVIYTALVGLENPQGTPAPDPILARIVMFLSGLAFTAIYAFLVYEFTIKSVFLKIMLVLLAIVSMVTVAFYIVQIFGLFQG